MLKNEKHEAIQSCILQDQANMSLHFRVSQTWLISMACSQGIHATCFLLQLFYHLVRGLSLACINKFTYGSMNECNKV